MRKLRARYFMLGPEHEDSLFDDVIGANKYHAAIHYKRLKIDVSRNHGWFISWAWGGECCWGFYICLRGVKWQLGLDLNDHDWRIGKWKGAPR